MIGKPRRRPGRYTPPRRVAVVTAEIPDNAQIIFQIKGKTDFNRWCEGVALAQKEPSQPVIKIEIDDLAPPLESRLINPHLIAA